MKRNIPIYLLLFSINYFIMKNLSLSDMAILSGILLLVTAIIFFGIFKLVKDQQRAAFITVIILGWALYYGSAVQVIENFTHVNFNLQLYMVFLAIWSAGILLISSKWIWRRLNRHSVITNFLNIMTLVTFIIFGYRVTVSETHTYLTQSVLPSFPANVAPPNGYLPDIYYIILDSYGRADMLSQMYGYDNTDFIDFLKNKGFYVADKSKSNYLYTALSMSSSLNMSYIQGLPGYPIRTPIIQKLISKSTARDFLKVDGYQFITFSTPAYFSNITDSDKYLSINKENANSRFIESMVLPATLAAIPLNLGLISPGGASYHDEQQRIYFTLNELTKISKMQEPVFVFTHLMIPHAPFIFDQTGPVSPDKPYILSGINSSQESKIGYIHQISYINTLLENTITKILNNSNNPPIIIIQGDHGPRAYLNNQADQAPCYFDSVSILNAYYFPGQINTPPYESISPVNTFRIIFNNYFGTQYKILDDKVYYSSGDAAYKFTDVTKESEQLCQIP